MRVTTTDRAALQSGSGGSHDQLNAHLRFMTTQGDAILLQGYSSDWSLSALRFRMVEKGAAGGKDVEFAKEADWLVGNLIDPQWVVSIRIE